MIYTTTEAGKMFNLNRNTIRSWILDGNIKHEMKGKTIILDDESINQLRHYILKKYNMDGDN